MRKEAWCAVPLENSQAEGTWPFAPCSLNLGLTRDFCLPGASLKPLLYHGLSACPPAIMLQAAAWGKRLEFRPCCKRCLKRHVARPLHHPCGRGNSATSDA